MGLKEDALIVLADLLHEESPIVRLQAAQAILRATDEAADDGIQRAVEEFERIRNRTTNEIATIPD